MPNLREILADWNGPGGSGGVSVFHTIETGQTIASDRLAIRNFLQAAGAVINVGYTGSVRTEGKVVDAATGVLVGNWADGTSQTFAGQAANAPIANASQILVRWRTGTIINGRQLRGRTFLPGMNTGSLLNGEVGAAAVTTVGNAAASLLSGSNPIAVWHRPTNGVGGQASVAVVATVWNELAVLRKRRS